jgi:hypothetical protein
MIHHFDFTSTPLGQPDHFFLDLKLPQLTLMTSVANFVAPRLEFSKAATETAPPVSRLVVSSQYQHVCLASLQRGHAVARSGYRQPVGMNVLE